MMVSAGHGATKTSAQKKISLLAVALLEAFRNYGTLDESQNGLWLTCGDSFALGVCRLSPLGDLFETDLPQPVILAGVFRLGIRQRLYLR